MVYQNMIGFPSLENIKEAHKRIKPYIHITPIFTSSGINRICNAKIYFKCENLQKVGAFKFRGATNAVLCLSKEEALRGVATHSSGNHAAALTLAARQRGIKAYIVMPRTAPPIKKKAVEAYGAEILLCDPTLKSREENLNEVVRQTNAVFIHPYNDIRVITGQATACLELLEEVGDLDLVIAPVGGGGLLSGTALSASYHSAKISVMGAEPEGANDACRSLAKGTIQPSVNPKTICDGLLTSLGTVTFPIIQKKVERILTTNDRYIIQAMRLIWERMKLIVEPSAAVTLAVLLKNKHIARNKKIGIILSGGNVDLENLPW
jgi:threonine dehydratase